MLGSSNSVNSFSKPFQPNDITRCVLAFHANDGVEVDGSAVVSWQDKSNSAKYAVAPTAGKRPVDNVTHITFDGSNDYLALLGSDKSTASPIELDYSDGGWTFIAIYTSTDWNGSIQAISGDPDDSQNFIRYRTNDKLEVKAGNSLKTFDLDTPSALVDNQYYLIEISRSDGEGVTTIYVDGVAQADTENDQENLTIEEIGGKGGSANILAGSIKHVIAYDKTLSAAERTQIVEWSQQHIG